MKYINKFNQHTAYTEYEASGTMAKPNVSYCVDNNDVHFNPIPHDFSQDYLTFVARESGTFTFTPQNNNVISYSTDGGDTWTQGNSVTVNNGDKVLWKGTMSSASSGVGTFSSTGEFDAEGNAISLLYGDDFKEQTNTKQFAFLALFKGAIKIVNASNLILSAAKAQQSCYKNMFSGCTSLAAAPELPATTLAPECYNSMFRGCTSLTKIPATLPATSLTSCNYCYQYMFHGCTSLTTAPELPATTLVNNCYEYMFSGCTSLTIAPELPATTLKPNCYQGMFQGCTSLTTAPELLATTLSTYCYNYMFNGCTSLNYIKAMFTTTPSTSYTENWVKNVASSGTFVKNSAAEWNVTGVHGIPTGWTVQTASS